MNNKNLNNTCDTAIGERGLGANLIWDDITSADYCESKCSMYEGCLGNRESCLKNNILKIFDTLTEMERTVLRLRCGFLGGKPFTLKEVADCLDITRENVRQIESRALRKLRHPSRVKRMADMGVNLNDITALENPEAAEGTDLP